MNLTKPLSTKKTFLNKFICLLQKHPLIILIGILFTISGGIFKVVDGWYSRENKILIEQLELEAKKNSDLLNEDLAKVKIAIGPKTGTVTRKDFFVDLMDLDPTYTVVQNKLFAVKEVSDNTGVWQWHLKSEEDLAKEAGIYDSFPSDSSVNLQNKKDIVTYESPSTIQVKIDDLEFSIRPRAIFRFIKWETFKEIARKNESMREGYFDSLIDRLVVLQ